MIRSTKHSIKYTNKNKLNKLFNFIDEYRQAAQLYLDYLWDNPYAFKIKDKSYIFDIQHNHLTVPKYIDYKAINFKTNLSARALSSCITQVLGIIKASTEKQRKRLWKVHNLLSQNEQLSKSLINKIRKNKPVKPGIDKLKPELSSKCIDFKETNNNFNAFIMLRSIGKSFGQIKIPIKYHKRANHWKSKGKRLNSFLIDKDYIDIRWQMPNKIKPIGITVGADQGYKTILTLSNGNITPKKDSHNHTLESINKKLARKRKGSKSFAKAQYHRKNFIHWSINQLNFKNIKQVNLEKIYNITYKRRTSRVMSHWTNTLIRDKLKKVCEEQEVLVQEQSSAYRSQRCSKCGLVRKANRKGKQYICKDCGHVSDADLNAACNHEQDLYYLSWELRKFIQSNHKNYGSGFYWQPNGCFDITGGEFRVPLSKNKPDNI